MDFKSKIRDIKDFPKEGILFRDISPLLQDGEAFGQMIDAIQEKLKDFEFDYIMGPEARGFIVGVPLAYAMKKGFIPVRKPGKLPYKTVRCAYELEYGTDALEVHADAIKKGDRIVLVDDLLATGGTIGSAAKLVEELEGEVVAIVNMIELVDLKGRENLKGYNVISLLQY